MTLKQYLFSDDLSTESCVLRCESANGTFNVKLDATLFHPQGGGQPSDIGCIGEAIVLKVIQDDSGIIHIIDRAVTVGKTRIKVDSASRLFNSRMHSAGHLIGVVGEQAGWKALKAIHRPGEGRIVFESMPGGTLLSASEFSDQVNKLISDDLQRRQFNEGESRMVTWGALPAYACGGTHVNSTRDIGSVAVTAVKLKKNQLSVAYDIN